MIHTILIVKQRKVAINYWAEVFKKTGYTVISYTTDEGDWEPFIRYHKPDLLFIETAFANGEGFDMARTARQAHWALRCIVCIPPVPLSYLQAIQLDMSGYLPDDVDDPDEVLYCLDQVSQGYRYINALFVEALHLPTQQHVTLLSTLTERQKQILNLVAKGNTARQIAQQLTIAESTVQNQKLLMSGKLGLDGVYQLKIFAGSVAHLLR